MIECWLERQPAVFSDRVIAGLMMLSTSAESCRWLFTLQGCCCKVAISTTAQAYAACRSVRHSRSHATPHFNARHFVSSPSACLHLLALPDMPLDFCFTSYARHNWIWQILLGIICIHIFVPSIIRVFVYRYKYRWVCALSCIINHGNLISAIISGV